MSVQSSWIQRNVLSESVMNLAGAAAAVLLFIASNILASRFFQRWDVTSDGLYTLSSPTLEVLSSIDAPVEVIVLLSRNDELTGSVRYLLDAYRARNSRIQTRFVDPDRNPAEFIAVQRQYGLLEGKTEDGRLAADASIIVAQGSRRWFVTTDDIVAFDDETGSVKPRLEQALTEAFAQIKEPRVSRVCVSHGHGELAWGAAGPQGLGELKARLERNNYEIRELDLSKADVRGEFTSCDVALVIGPSRPFEAAVAEEFHRALDAGVSLLLALGPIVDDEGRILDPGFGPVLKDLGVRSANNVVFERDEALRMPVGIGGEAFFATPKSHPVTLGMLHGEEVELRVLTQLTQSFAIAEGSSASALLVSGPSSVAIDDFRIVQRGALEPASDLAESEKVLALATQLGPGPDPTKERRVAVVGTPSVFWSSTWQEPGLLGTRRFVESLVSWVAAKPPLVSVPEKASHPAGLALTEDGLAEVQRYVLFYMPLCAALIGVLLLLRRRHEDTGPNVPVDGGTP
jgi:ABC-type uncharacterized transport system